MISVIVPSRNKTSLNILKDNIKNTIGVPYEIITYNNSKDGFGICKIYNQCAAKAKYDYLVFCHDDLIFHSNNWGGDLAGVLSKVEIGLVGIAGATFKSKYPAPWVSVPLEYYRCNKFGEERTISLNKTDDYENVAVIDGCFMSMRKNVWNNFNFNENNLSGFHIYDIDLSIRILSHYKVIVWYDVVIEHKSEGVFDNRWYKESKLYHKNHQELLPAIIDRDYPIIKLNAFALKSLIFRSPKLGMSFIEKFQLILKFLINYPSLFSYKMIRVLL